MVILFLKKIENDLPEKLVKININDKSEKMNFKFKRSNYYKILAN